MSSSPVAAPATPPGVWHGLTRGRSRTPPKSTTVQSLSTSRSDKHSKNFLASRQLRIARQLKQKYARERDFRELQDLRLRQAVEKEVEKIVEVEVPCVPDGVNIFSSEQMLSKFSQFLTPMQTEINTLKQDKLDLMLEAKEQAEERLKLQRLLLKRGEAEGAEQKFSTASPPDSSSVGGCSECAKLRAGLQSAHNKIDKLKTELEKRIRVQPPGALVEQVEQMQTEIAELRGRLAEVEGESDGLDEGDDDDSNDSDGYGHAFRDDSGDDEFSNPHQTEDERLTMQIHGLEGLRCPFSQGCRAEMGHAQAGPACNESRLCERCGVALAIPGRFGRKSRVCAKHHKYLCLSCAHVALQTQVRQQLGDG